MAKSFLLPVWVGLLALALGLVAAGEMPSVDAPADGAFNLLTNPGVELYDPPYGEWHGVDCQVATGWQRYWIVGPEPAWMDTRAFAASEWGSGWVERIEGETSQMIASTEPYTAGIRQQVTGLTPGIGYGFTAAMLTIFQSAAPPPVHGTMFKRVGIDPTGGTDPTAPTVVWSEPDGHDEGPWDLQRRIAAWAEDTQATVFIQVDSPFPAGLLPFINQSFLDSAILAQTPSVEASSPSTSLSPEFTVNWDNVELAPGGGQFRGCDVEWMDEADGVWHAWLQQTFQVGSTFVGRWGHTFRFRARAWQSYPNGAWLHGPYRSAGDCHTYIIPPQGGIFTASLPLILE